MTNRRRSRKKTSNVKTIFLAIGFLVFLSCCAILLVRWWHGRGIFVERPTRIRYKNFGIHIPPHFPIHGIDVSKHQGIINWDLVKSMSDSGIKIGFAFIKATEGESLTDRYFDRNWEKARSVGLTRGAYHFFNPLKTGEEQAENFIAAVRLVPGDLPPVLDVETRGGISRSKLQGRVQAFLRIIERHYRVTPIIYTNVKFYDDVLGDAFDRYPFWVAHYLRYDSPRTTRTWSLWQHSERGLVNGIKGKVDFNVFNGDSLTFRSLLLPRR